MRDNGVIKVGCILLPHLVLLINGLFVLNLILVLFNQLGVI